METLSAYVYPPEQVRELDRVAIEEMGIPGYELMCRAGQAAFDAAHERYTFAMHWLVLCGAGNNAGDGYVIAGLARKAGLDVTVVALVDPEKLQGDAATAWKAFHSAGGAVVSLAAADFAGADLVVDALLGTGLARELDGEFLQAVAAINASGLPVLAVDLPSGLNGSSGVVMGAAVRASLTVSFVGLKQGFYLADGPDCTGELVFSDLDIPFDRVQHVPPALRIFQQTDLDELLPRRPRTAHKGLFGHVLVVGGNAGMGGAVALAGAAALRAGAGLVTVATRPANVPVVNAACPELMAIGVVEAQDLATVLQRASVIALGPGLGADAWAAELFDYLVGLPVPKVIDADALNLLAASPQRRDDWVLTPHPGEAARLLNTDTGSVQRDRIATLAELCERYGGAAILKGHASLVGTAGELPFLITGGNPGMASAGMGDVLTGISAAFLAQNPSAGASRCAAAAAFAHASAGDAAAAEGERGMLATDLIAKLRTCLNHVV
ncbi:MAG: NAD(P)H-hydrate dehydratase [Gammaproteobacteria bacterium]